MPLLLAPYDFALGGEGLDPSIPIGANGALLQPGQSFMVDMGGNFYGYMGDMSRVSLSVSYRRRLMLRIKHVWMYRQL